MKHWLIIIIVVLLGTACNDFKKVPSSVIQPNKMQNVLWDVMLADRYIEQYITQDTTKNVLEERSKLYSQIFSIHSISSEDFKKSMEYYYTRPDQLKQIYMSIRDERAEISRLSDMEAAAIEEQQLREQDSLMRIADSIEALKGIVDSAKALMDSTTKQAIDSVVDQTIKDSLQPQPSPTSDVDTTELPGKKRRIPGIRNQVTF